MGMMPAPNICHLTDIPTTNASSPLDAAEYFVEFNGKKYFFTFHWNHKNSEFVEKNKHILKGLLLNDKFPFLNEKHIFDNKILEKIINEAEFPRTPKNKLDSLLLFIYENQSHEGAKVDFKKYGDWNYFLYRMYFKNNEEYWFYLKTLKELNLISFIDTTSKDGNSAIDIRLTYQGLDYIINIQESGENSKKCFIAMSFSKTASETRDIIKKVIRETGYEPILIDEVHYDSSLTINDAIIKFIKQSKFIIADFTEQKHGVYFETGFAIGLKRPVIYTCSSKDFKDTHFDTNHYPHIVYNDLTELENKLKDKILALIE